MDTVAIGQMNTGIATESPAMTDPLVEIIDAQVERLVSARRVSKDINIYRNSANEVIRAYEGVDIKAIYESKSIAYKAFKRLCDIIISLVGLIVLSPVFLILSVMIKLEDGGPAIFAGMRWGKDCKLFPMYKFRSMCVDAESRTKEVLTEEDKNGMAFKVKDDPRVTKIGAFIRKTTLDELPQLWNVLLGQMSIVGPRPIQTTREDGDPYEMQRWCVKPGITCYWQVCGRSIVPWDEWVEMDLAYIEKMSVLTDLQIMLRTFGAVFSRVGAR